MGDIIYIGPWAGGTSSTSCFTDRRATNKGILPPVPGSKCMMSRIWNSQIAGHELFHRSPGKSWFKNRRATNKGILPPVLCVNSEAPREMLDVRREQTNYQALMHRRPWCDNMCTLYHHDKQNNPRRSGRAADL